MIYNELPKDVESLLRPRYKKVKKSNKSIVVKGASGFGNRILGLMEVFVYSRLTGRRVFVDWRDGMYGVEGINVFNLLFSSPFVANRNKIPKKGRVYNPIWEGKMDKSVYRVGKSIGTLYPKLKEYSVDLTRDSYKENILISFDGYFQFERFDNYFDRSYKSFNRHQRYLFLKSIMKKSLFIQPEIRKRIDKFKRDNFSGKIIGVHIRYTDNLKHKTRKTSLNLYNHFINKLMRDNPGAKIFLATDNKEVLDFYREKYPDIICRDKLYPNDKNKALHQTNELSDKFGMGVDALVEMYLLSECDYLIYSSRSSFSYISHLLSDIPESNVIDTEIVRGSFSFGNIVRIIDITRLKAALFYNRKKEEYRLSFLRFLGKMGKVARGNLHEES